MTALEALEQEANQRGVTKIVTVWNPREEPGRRWAALPVGGSGFTVRWFHGHTVEDAIEQLVYALPIAPIAPESDVRLRVEADPFPESHPYRRSA